MEALGALAVAERHIRALRTARADRGSLRRLNWTRARLALPVRQETQSVRARYRPFQVEMACETRILLAD